MSERSAEIHRRQLDDIAELAGISIENLMLTLAPYPMREWAVVLRELLPEIVFLFGPAAGQLGVQYYNERKAVLIETVAEEELSSIEGAVSFRANASMIPQDLIREGIDKSIDFFVGSVFNKIDAGELTPENPEKEIVEYLADLPNEKIEELTQELKNVAGRDISNFSRKTIAVAANLDPAPLIPVRAVNENGCDYCRLLHHRGRISQPKYYNPKKDQATGHFHPGCRCTVDLAPSGDVIPPEWYMDFQDEYDEAVTDAGTTSRNRLLSQMRKNRKAKEAKASEG